MADNVQGIYLGNLPVTSSEDDVRTLFSTYGEVVDVTLMIDRETGQSRGFGFVQMNVDDAFRAIDGLDGQEFEGRTLRVNEARDRGGKAPRRAF